MGSRFFGDKTFSRSEAFSFVSILYSHPIRVTRTRLRGVSLSFRDFLSFFFTERKSFRDCMHVFGGASCPAALLTRLLRGRHRSALRAPRLSELRLSLSTTPPPERPYESLRPRPRTSVG